jgi:uncharacterized membrane protein
MDAMTHLTAAVCFYTAIVFAGIAWDGGAVFGVLAALLVVAGGMLLLEEKT